MAGVVETWNMQKHEMEQGPKLLPDVQWHNAPKNRQHDGMYRTKLLCSHAACCLNCYLCWVYVSICGRQSWVVAQNLLRRRTKVFDSWSTPCRIFKRWRSGWRRDLSRWPWPLFSYRPRQHVKVFLCEIDQSDQANLGEGREVAQSKASHREPFPMDLSRLEISRVFFQLGKSGKQNQSNRAKKM